jgi:agmatine/peptidylarginine deiminase
MPTPPAVRLPAEWEAQYAVMLTWPHPDSDWGPSLAEVEPLYERIAATIARYEPVLIVCRDHGHRDAVAERLRTAGVPGASLVLAIAPGNDTWARDHGPITVVGEDGRATPVDFRFNGWGGKFPAELDDRITAALHTAGFLGSADLVSSALVLEGGAIESDGAGTVLAVRRTLVDPARNPAWSQAEIEAELGLRLGAERVLWLDHGQVSGDDTDGHIDTLARFSDPATICYAACTDPLDADRLELERMQDELRALRQVSGEPYRLIPLPQPSPIHDADGHRLPAGYANFLIVNGAVLVPVYGDAADAVALARLAEAFPARTVEPVDCRPLIRQGGSLHCITMQLPAALRPVSPAAAGI